MRIAIVLLLTLVPLLQTKAATIHVPQDQPTIQSGIYAAVNGDTVLVAPGTYAEHLNFGGRNIVLMSSAGRDSTTIIKANLSTPLVTLSTGEDSSAVVSGFTFLANGLRAIDCLGSSPKIEYNAFLGGDEAIESAEVVFLDGGSPIVRFNVFTRNKGWCINIQEPGTHAIVTNNTMAKNFFSCVRLSNTPSIVKNNIMVFNDGEGIHQRWSATAIVAYNNVHLNLDGDYFGVEPGIGSISIDPAFCDSLTGDFSLSSISQCVGVGDGGVNIGACEIGCAFPVKIGDADRNGNITISDAVYLINYIFIDGTAPNPLRVGDVNCNGIVSVPDVVYLINYIFAGGDPPCA